jgi:hypothetical protein
VRYLDNASSAGAHKIRLLAMVSSRAALLQAFFSSRASIQRWRKKRTISRLPSGPRGSV